MTNPSSTTPTKPKTAPPQEHYLAPTPSENATIFAIDQHPDVNVLATVTGMTPHDMTVHTVTGDLSMEKLVAHLQQHASAKDIILVESGNGSFELSRRLAKQGLNCTILESAWVGAQADKYVDNDKLAAIRIARVYLQGQAKAVWQPDQATLEKRQLLHLHLKAKQARTRAINSLRGFLTGYGIRPGNKTLSNAKHQDWIRKQRPWTPSELFTLEDLLDDLTYTTTRSRHIEQQIATHISHNPDMLALMSLLGIGMINAFALIAAIGDINRFKTPKKLVSYLGLNPNAKTSGRGKNQTSGVGTKGRKDLRSLLIQGAQAVLRQGSRSDKSSSGHLLAKWGMALMMRKGHRNIAVSAIARKMVMQVWHLLMGHKSDWLEPTKSRNTKYTKLMGTLGKEKRTQLSLPNKVDDCLNYFNELIKNKNLQINS